MVLVCDAHTCEWTIKECWRQRMLIWIGIGRIYCTRFDYFKLRNVNTQQLASNSYIHTTHLTSNISNIYFASKKQYGSLRRLFKIGRISQQKVLDVIAVALNFIFISTKCHNWTGLEIKKRKQKCCVKWIKRFSLFNHKLNLNYIHFRLKQKKCIYKNTLWQKLWKFFDQ